MKKVLQGLIVATLAMSMIGCGGKKEIESVSSSSTASSDQKKDKKDKAEKDNDTDKDSEDVDTKTDEDDEPLTPKEKKEKEVSSGAVADTSKFPVGEYFVTKKGMHVRKRTSTSSTTVYENFPVGTVLEITSIKTGEKDPTTVWGKIKSPVSGWICIADYYNCYLMTPEEWRESSFFDKQQTIGETVDDSDVDSESIPEELLNKDGITIEVKIEWEGDAAAGVDEIPYLDFTLHDETGPCHVKLSADNNWSSKLKLAKGSSFWCDLDFSDYPFITEFDYKWNVSTGTITYIVS